MRALGEGTRTCRLVAIGCAFVLATSFLAFAQSVGPSGTPPKPAQPPPALPGTAPTSQQVSPAPPPVPRPRSQEPPASSAPQAEIAQILAAVVDTQAKVNALPRPSWIKDWSPVLAAFLTALVAIISL